MVFASQQHSSVHRGVFRHGLLQHAVRVEYGFGDTFAKFNPIFDSGKPDPKTAHDIEDAIDAFNPKVYALDLAMQRVIAEGTSTCAVQEPK
jgi:hypothetical protein